MSTTTKRVCKRHSQSCAKVIRLEQTASCRKTTVHKTTTIRPVLRVPCPPLPKHKPRVLHVYHTVVVERPPGKLPRKKPRVVVSTCLRARTVPC